MLKRTRMRGLSVTFQTRLWTEHGLPWPIVDAEYGMVQYSICLVEVVVAKGAQVKTVLLSEPYGSILYSTSSTFHTGRCGVRNLLLAEADEYGFLFASGPLCRFAGDFFHEPVSVLSRSA